MEYHIQSDPSSDFLDCPNIHHPCSCLAWSVKLAYKVHRQFRLVCFSRTRPVRFTTVSPRALLDFTALAGNPSRRTLETPASGPRTPEPVPVGPQPLGRYPFPEGWGVSEAARRQRTPPGPRVSPPGLASAGALLVRQPVRGLASSAP